MKHTQGNWSALTENKTRYDSFTGEKYFEEAVWVANGGSRIALICHGSKDANADAKLIAAAPEMYQALEQALVDLKFFNGHISLIEAALKKARGES